jgi:hypothetical protein
MLVVPVFIELSLEDQVVYNFVRVVLSIPQCSFLKSVVEEREVYKISGKSVNLLV